MLPHIYSEIPLGTLVQIFLTLLSGTGKIIFKSLFKHKYTKAMVRSFLILNKHRISEVKNTFIGLNTNGT